MEHSDAMVDAISTKAAVFIIKLARIIAKVTLLATDNDHMEPLCSPVSVDEKFLAPVG